MAPIMVDGDRKKLQIKLTSQMRNYAKWDLLELNKLCCVFFSDKIHLSNTENENHFSAAYHTHQIIMKNGKA